MWNAVPLRTWTSQKLLKTSTVSTYFIALIQNLRVALTLVIRETLTEGSSNTTEGPGLAGPTELATKGLGKLFEFLG